MWIGGEHCKYTKMLGWPQVAEDKWDLDADEYLRAG